MNYFDSFLNTKTNSQSDWLNCCCFCWLVGWLVFSFYIKVSERNWPLIFLSYKVLTVFCFQRCKLERTFYLITYKRCNVHDISIFNVWKNSTQKLSDLGVLCCVSCFVFYQRKFMITDSCMCFTLKYILSCVTFQNWCFQEIYVAF